LTLAPFRSSLACVCFAALMLPVASTAQPTASAAASADEAAALAWLRKAAVPLSSESPSPGELKPLLERLRGARVLGLGEATHGSHEDFAFKAALIKALVDAGRINAIAFITHFQSGKRLDTYVAGGPGTVAQALGESGLPPVWTTREVAELLEWLRGRNLASDSRIRVVGVDVQDVLRDTQSALAVLASVEPEAAGPLLEVWKDQLTSDKLQQPFVSIVRGWTRDQWEKLFVAAQVLEDLLARPTTRLAQQPGYADAKHAARAARLGLLVHEVGATGTSAPESIGDAELARDLSIGEQLLAVVGPPARAVLWAHDAQVARGETGRAAAYTTGDLLLDRLGSAYRTVGFAWQRGSFHTLAPGGGFEVLKLSLPGDSLGALLAKTGQRRAWFDLGTLPKAEWSPRWLAKPYARGWYGMAAGGDAAPPAALGHGFDVLVFFHTITPSRPLARSP